MPGVLFIVIIRVLSRSICGFFRRLRPGGRLLVAPVKVPPSAMMAGAVPPVVPPLPGALALRCPGRLPGLLLRLRWLLPGILWLRTFFCHNCQTD